MTRQPDFDRAVTDWLDDGADLAPERFVWAAIDDLERTPQRVAWVATTEEFLVQLKRAMPVLGIAAAVVLALVAYQYVASPTLGDFEPPPRAYTPDDLRFIAMTEDNAPAGVEVGTITTGRAALYAPLRAGGSVIETSEFLDAINTELDLGGRGYTTWAAVFDNEEAAMLAFDFLVEEHESPDGWSLEGTLPHPPLGDESVVWTGQQYDFESARTFFWREENLLLAVIGWWDWNDKEVRELADDMADRAR